MLWLLLPLHRTVKPLIGFISDTIPLFGYHRRSYLVLASVTGAAAFMLMAGEHATVCGL